MTAVANTVADSAAKISLGEVELRRHEVVERFASMTAHSQEHAVYTLDHFTVDQWWELLRAHLRRYGVSGGSQVPMSNHVAWAEQLVTHLTGSAA